VTVLGQAVHHLRPHKAGSSDDNDAHDEPFSSVGGMASVATPSPTETE
jgi:hypothetical protein